MVEDIEEATVAGIVEGMLPLAGVAVFIRGSELSAWRGSRVETPREGTLARASEVGASREATLSIVRVGSSRISYR